MKEPVKSLVLVAVLSAALAGMSLVCASPSAGAAGYTRCQDVVIRNGDGSIYTQTKGLFQKRTSCRLAHRLAHRYLENDAERPPRLFGFVCSGGSDGVSCRSGQRKVTWGYYYDRSGRPARAFSSQELLGDLELSPRGLGPVHFGSTAREASDALAAPIEVEPGVNGCSHWSLPGVGSGVSLTSFKGRLGYILLYERGTRTTRGVQVGDDVKRLRNRYRGHLRGGKSASLSGADLHLFTDEHRAGATFTIDFEIVGKRIAFIAAGTRHVIETFGECS